MYDNLCGQSTQGNRVPWQSPGDFPHQVFNLAKLCPSSNSVKNHIHIAYLRQSSSQIRSRSHLPMSTEGGVTCSRPFWGLSLLTLTNVRSRAHPPLPPKEKKRTKEETKKELAMALRSWCSFRHRSMGVCSRVRQPRQDLAGWKQSASQPTCRLVVSLAMPLSWLGNWSLLQLPGQKRRSLDNKPSGAESGAPVRSHVWKEGSRKVTTGQIQSFGVLVRRYSPARGTKPKPPVRRARFLHSWRHFRRRLRRTVGRVEVFNGLEVIWGLSRRFLHGLVSKKMTFPLNGNSFPCSFEGQEY